MASSSSMLELIQRVKDHFGPKRRRDFLEATMVVANIQRLVLNHPGHIFPTDSINLQIAGLLHSLDDVGGAFPFKHSKILMQTIFVDEVARHELILLMMRMIPIYPFGLSIPLEPSKMWMAYPRFAVFLEHIGRPGIIKAFEEHELAGKPLYLDTTPRPRTPEDIRMACTAERFEAYVNQMDKDPTSVSFIDHFYDKLFHLCTPDAIEKAPVNIYLLEELDKRERYMVNFVLSFNLTGVIPSVYATLGTTFSLREE